MKLLQDQTINNGRILVQDETQDVYTGALTRLEDLFRRYPLRTISYSGGKDSTILFELAYEVAQARNEDLHVVVFDEEVIDPDTLAHSQKTVHRPGIIPHWFCVPLRHTIASKARAFWLTWDPDQKPVWMRDPPAFAHVDLTFRPPAVMKNGNGVAQFQEKYFSEYFKGEPWVGCSGIRIQESLNRRRSLRRGGYLVKKNGHFYAKPIYDWTTDDVWRAIDQFDWAYSPVYEKMAVANFPLSERRVAPWGNVYSARSANFWQTFYPEFWKKAIVRLPELDTQARYGNSPLYRDVLNKPVGMTWMEYTFGILGAYEKDTQIYWLKRIHSMIRRWYEVKTVPFPDEGILVEGDLWSSHCWKTLAYLVAKNDLTTRIES